MIKEVLRKCQKHERRMKEERKKRREGGGEKEGEEREKQYKYETKERQSQNTALN